MLLGCGKMGSALLKGWLDDGLPPDRIEVREPHPSDWLTAQAERGLRIAGPAAATAAPPPSAIVVAVKPQTMDTALASLSTGPETLTLSIAAGIRIARFEAALGPRSAIVRAMPNTPAAIGRGVTALVGNAAAAGAGLALAERLMGAVGQTVRLDSEDQMDAVTALSGSGPAYVFHLIECMAEAGVRQGLPPEMALVLARATVAGAGALAEAGDDPPDRLRQNVTSPGGTTAAALAVLMDAATGLGPLMQRAIDAAARRSRELAAPADGGETPR